MKFFKYILATTVSLTLLNACDEDQLSVTNPNKSAVEDFYTTPAQVQAAVNGVYANLQTQGLYQRHMFFMMDNMSHENAGNPQLEADKRQYLDFAFDASHGPIRAYWESCYRGINKANFITDNTDKIDAILSLSDDLRTQYYSEAKFLRALYYFFLVTRFGDIPLLTSVPKDGEGTPKSPASAVYDQIVRDLTDAAAGLPIAKDAENGRATAGAAWALLGKVELYRENYTAAQTAFSNVTGYSLLSLDKYNNNFTEAGEHNAESIFEVMFDANIGNGDQWNSDASGQGLTEATFRGQEYGWNDWFNVYPSDHLLDAFEEEDPRFEANFYVTGDSIANKGVAEIPSGRRAGWRKYQNYYQRTNENTNSGINPRVIRYADVLLMQAEVENALNNPSGAIAFLNQVRDRVGMPQYGSAEMDAAGYPVTNQDEIFDAIVHERMVELAGEQARFPDLVRWGLAEEVLGANGLNTGYTSNKNEVFPIPQQEIDFNNKLTTADQNNGY